ncbi:hypothetical protein BDV95DRAFT_3353 [Massariosphaeria phaeospora]|uniref:Uncharacterized protein n=1 Tax=Massariosphaeria phaeospora TaxID=100035 RepID=A0A7C8MJH0_9PLEO|nr:hypothetical protein BDV95DRAFT_3353 [Massariosphaeria phaeospora]
MVAKRQDSTNAQRHITRCYTDRWCAEASPRMEPFLTSLRIDGLNVNMLLYTTKQFLIATAKLRNSPRWSNPVITHRGPPHCSSAPHLYNATSNPAIAIPIPTPAPALLIDAAPLLKGPAEVVGEGTSSGNAAGDVGEQLSIATDTFYVQRGAGAKIISEAGTLILT